HECSGTIVRTTSVKFKENQLVSVNPYQDGKFMGVTLNGCLSEFIVVNNEYIVLSKPNLTCEQTAYVEPVASVMAILKANLEKDSNGIIYGNNRIAQLTHTVLNTFGYKNIKIIGDDDEDSLHDNYYDFIIESQIDEKIFKKLIQILKPNGLLILKSRKFTPTEIIINDLVLKDINIKCLSYYNDFDQAMQWILDNSLEVNKLIGKSFHISDFKEALSEAVKGESNKIFIHF
ncbi:unnamed protein product, partial [Didymodactylos carnosus]